MAKRKSKKKSSILKRQRLKKSHSNKLLSRIFAFICALFIVGCATWFFFYKAKDTTPRSVQTNEVTAPLNFSVDYSFHKSVKRHQDLIVKMNKYFEHYKTCLLYTSPSPRDATLSRMPSSA